MVEKLQLQNWVSARAFCAALLLLDHDLSAAAAANWFVNGDAPRELGYPNRTGFQQRLELQNADLVAATLRAIGGGLVVCFDQLEGLADTPDPAGNSTALARLVQEAVRLAERHPNVSCVISALPEVADAAVGALPTPDQHRVRGEQPFAQSLQSIAPGDVGAFLEPRLAYLNRKVSNPATLRPVRLFVNWVADRREIGLSPRLLLHAMHRYGHGVRFSSAAPDADEQFLAAWTEAISSFGGGEAFSAQSGVSDVEAHWQRVQIEPSVNVVAEDASDASELLDWALRNVATTFAGVAEIANVARAWRQEMWTVSFELRFVSGEISSRTLYLCDAKNYAGALVSQLTSLISVSNTKVIALRLFDKFPSGPQSKVRAPLESIKRNGGIVLDLLPSELINLAQLQALRQRVDGPVFAEWCRLQSALAPSLLRSVALP